MNGALHDISLGDLAQASNGSLVGTDSKIRSVSTDSRSIASGDVYFCLRGENFDGHDYAQASVAAGAVAIVCERCLDSGVAEVLVPDTRRAYGVLAMLWRKQLSVKLIGVTGSNGKTTVKQLLKEVCAEAGSVQYTRANDNNDIGVPQTLLRIDQSHQFAVVEMGANQLGEIEWLGSISKPNVAIITNVSASHIEGFGSLEAVCREKSAIYTSLAEDGVAIVNRDDQFADEWLRLNQNRSVITFGSDVSADVYAEQLSVSQIRLHCQIDGCESTIETQCNLVGAHNLLNIAAAAAAAMACGIDLAVVARGVSNAAPVKGRLNFHQLTGGLTLIDDTYNANPASARAAIDVLASVAAERWLVLADLKELGEDAALHHTALGEFALEKSIDRLYATGELCRYTVKAFGDRAQWFDDKDGLLEQLQQELECGADNTIDSMERDTVVLVKGSRSMAMNEVVDALQENFAKAASKVAGEAL